LAEITAPLFFCPYGCGNLVALSAPRWGQREGRDYTLKKQWGGIQRIIRAVLVGWIEDVVIDTPYPLSSEKA